MKSSPTTTTAALEAAFEGWRRRNFPWYPRRGKRERLAQVFGALGFTEGVEVGTQRGLWARVLCDSAPTLHLTCVDPWRGGSRKVQRMHDEKYALALENLAGRNVTIVRKPSMDAVGSFADASLDFVYIDGDHSFDRAMEDMIYWTPKVRPGGVVCVHDYHPFVGVDVIAAVDAYTRGHDVRPWYVTREELPTAFWVKP